MENERLITPLVDEEHSSRSERPPDLVQEMILIDNVQRLEDRDTRQFGGFYHHTIFGFEIDRDEISLGRF